MMVPLMLALLAGSAAPIGSDGISMAKRVVAAIKGEAQFQDSDFLRPLGADDKSALRRFAACKVGLIDYTLLPDPKERDTYVKNPNYVLVTFDCKGVPGDSPAGLSFHLQDGKIATIETHNADLMRKP